MYDIDRDGRLSKEDIQEILKMMVNKKTNKICKLIFEVFIGWEN